MRDITQAQLAEQVGVSQQTICRLERSATRSVAWETVARISKVLGVAPEVLFPVQDLEPEVFGESPAVPR
jgi:transcriptional regulator with XRE-family HTH domain